MVFNFSSLNFFCEKVQDQEIRFLEKIRFFNVFLCSYKLSSHSEICKLCPLKNTTYKLLKWHDTHLGGKTVLYCLQCLSNRKMKSNEHLQHKTHRRNRMYISGIFQHCFFFVFLLEKSNEFGTLNSFANISLNILSIFVNFFLFERQWLFL